MHGKRDASGLLYMRNRYYDPAQGRFTQPDPIGLAGGLNLYGFANGDPVGYSDPYGLAADCPNPPCRSGNDKLAKRPLPPNVDEADVTWDQSLNKGKGGYIHDADGTLIVPHAGDNWHWDHWDIKTPGNNRRWTQYPQRSLKPNARTGSLGSISPIDPWAAMDAASRVEYFGRTLIFVGRSVTTTTLITPIQKVGRWVEGFLQSPAWSAFPGFAPPPPPIILW
jgi:RHS repeat-associated protein